MPSAVLQFQQPLNITWYSLKPKDCSCRHWRFLTDFTALLHTLQRHLERKRDWDGSTSEPHSVLIAPLELTSRLARQSFQQVPDLSHGQGADKGREGLPKVFSPRKTFLWTVAVDFGLKLSRCPNVNGFILALNQQHQLSGFLVLFYFFFSICRRCWISAMARWLCN